VPVIQCDPTLQPQTSTGILSTPKRCRWTWFTAAALLGSLLFLVFVLGRSNEPAYDGKTLTQWLQIYRPNPSAFEQPNDFYGHIHNELWDRLREVLKSTPAGSNTLEASAPVESSTGQLVLAEEVVAIQQFGTNGIPHLIQLMTAKPTPGQKIRLAIAEHLPHGAGEFVYPYFRRSPAKDCHTAARDGFTILGTNAEPALPALSNLLFTGEADFPLTSAIAGIGPRGIALLTTTLARQPRRSRDESALALGLCGAAATSAIPALLNCVEQGHASYQVFGAIGRIGGESVLVVPTLTKYLETTNVLAGGELDAAMAMMILGLRGENARPAVPAMVKLYGSGDPTTRQVIRFVLKKIDGEQVARLLGRASATNDDEDPWWGGAQP
jgi:hypothetical protein